MGDRTATVIIEPRSLMREALVSLMERHSYDVVCSVASTADIDRGAFKEVQPKLVILGVLPAERVAEAMSSIRGRWQGAKVVMLFEEASSLDLQKLLASGLDACIPMFASPRTLIDTLQRIVCEQLRVLMVSDSAILEPFTGRQADDEDGSKLEGRPRIASFIPGLELFASEMPGSRPAGARAGGAHGLSQREDQILKALVGGHSNKMIARSCTVTEATVKVHVKSILRKIRVANRTQAAVWALNNEYFADVNETPPKGMQAAPAVNGAN
jgi:two-component system, NarL family, nitrate/nitrite response regulator NarL